MKTLTVYTPTYNRVHTIVRTYESLCRQSMDDFDWLIIDDGSTDGTREWVESLGEKNSSFGTQFDWMGRKMEGEDENHFTIQTEKFSIEYVYKPNGGLYTGYNVAYATIQTELCVCIDSDDYMPDYAVGRIVQKWMQKPVDKEYCGLLGLDFNVADGKPIGGYFPNSIEEVFFHDMRIKKLHTGDTKPVMRTALMKEVTPQVGFLGEKNFNPVYMMMQVCDKLPLLVMNENLCWVEYQIGADSMSQGIYKQYVNSPRSFAKMRLLEMSLSRNSTKDRFRSCIHYVASCMIYKDPCWLRKSNRKIMTLCAAPIGFFWYCFIMLKNLKK